MNSCFIPSNVTAFLKSCVDRKLSSASLWSMDWMRNRAPELWQAMAEFDWKEDSPVPNYVQFEELPEPERWNIVGDDLRHRGIIDYNGA